jgi:hypothetical protein
LAAAGSILNLETQLEDHDSPLSIVKSIMGIRSGYFRRERNEEPGNLRIMVTLVAPQEEAPVTWV